MNISHSLNNNKLVNNITIVESFRQKNGEPNRIWFNRRNGFLIKTTYIPSLNKYIEEKLPLRIIM